MHRSRRRRLMGQKILDCESSEKKRLGSTAAVGGKTNMAQQVSDFILHDYLKIQRHKIGLTQREVAEKAEIAIQQYQKFESGERNLLNASFVIASAVLEALDFDIGAFWQECEKQHNQSIGVWRRKG